MFRKGQNYRIFINGSVVAEETSCTVTRGVDTEDAANKDLAADSTYGNIGGANPVAMYKNMQFQVEAQGEGAILLFQSALLLMNTVGGNVAWGPTSGTNNRAPDVTSLRAVKAICNDLTINAPNRQPVTCTAQFIAIPGNVSPHVEPNPYMPSFNVLRGEFLRLFLGGTNSIVIAQATNVSLHISLSMEDATTKDDTSASATQLDFKSQVPTQINYDISSECIYEGGLHTLTVGEPYPWSLAKASGEGQATKGDMLVFGTAMLTNLTANAAVNQSITYSGTFTGVGVLNTPKTSNSLRNSESTATTEEEEQQEGE
jgi:hypothetical protein